MKYLGIKHGYFLPSLTHVDEPVNSGGIWEKISAGCTRKNWVDFKVLVL